MKQKIIIVGGVAGGASAAARARRLCEGASITMLERGPHVSFANCGVPYALGGVIRDEQALLLQTPESLKRRFNIDVQINAEVVNIDRKRKLVEVKKKGDGVATSWLPYDKLILSLGAEAICPPIPGGEGPQVFTLQTVVDMQNIDAFIKKHNVRDVVIIGGGFIGLEAAENLRHRGLSTTIVELGTQVFAPVDDDIADVLHTELKTNGIDLRLRSQVHRIEAATEDQRGRVSLGANDWLPADMVVMAIGVKPRATLARKAGLMIGKTGGLVVNAHMQTEDPDIYAVGDMIESEHRVSHTMVNIPLAGPANRQGRLAADSIFGRPSLYRGTVGTSVCQIFSLTVASTGLAVKALQKMNRPVQWVTVHPSHHASYFPGAQPMTLKLIFDPNDGLVLGAQVVGRAGVDKRIDVLSTAIQANMNVRDLEALELAYSPPYGAAKDPINMAGFVASNTLQGDVFIVHPQDIEAMFEVEGGCQLVDVRSPEEYARGHLKRSINVPIDELRERIAELRKEQPIIAYCHVGFRGYLASRILSQHGYRVSNLDGGYLSVIHGPYKNLISTGSPEQKH